MKNKITVSIAGQEYTMVAEEGEEYVKRCAALVDSQVRDVMNGARLGRSDAAVLAAMNIADQFFKEQEASENLRRQIKEGLDENAKLKMELRNTEIKAFIRIRLINITFNNIVLISEMHGTAVSGRRRFFNKLHCIFIIRRKLFIANLKHFLIRLIILMSCVIHKFFLSAELIFNVTDNYYGIKPVLFWQINCFVNFIFIISA